MQKPSDSKLNLLKFARILVYVVYAYLIIAVSFLITGFCLLLLGASQTASFVDFVYRIAAEFLQPFRGMFPPHQITDNAYFSAAGLFAIIMYGLFAVAVHSLVSWLTLKQAQHQEELIEIARQEQLQAEKERAQADKAATQRPTSRQAGAAPKKVQ